MEELTKEQLMQKIAELEKVTAMLKAEARAKLTMKVSAKGAVSVYGLGRFPVTLYGSQWRRIIDNVEEMEKFLVNHGPELAVKGIEKEAE